MKTQMTYGAILFSLSFALFSCSNRTNGKNDKNDSTTFAKIETFTFLSNGEEYKGKIYLPASHEVHKNVPAIFLVDFTEQHYKIATDEFEKVIEGIDQLIDFDAFVISLDSIPDIDAKPEAFAKHYSIFKNMAEYVEINYTENPSKTFIGRGSESGIVLMSLLLDSGNDATFDNFIATDPGGGYKTALIELLQEKDIPKFKTQKRLHFSFSTTNNRDKCTKIYTLINELNDSRLQLKFNEYTESDYEHTYPISYAEGIKFVFNE